jgi:hypothetical protein
MSVGRAVGVMSLTIIALGSPGPVGATSLLPLSAQEAKTLPNGTAEAILSFGYFDALWFPPFTEPGTVCCQTLISAPSFGFNIGLGDRVEVQASYELLYLDETVLGQGDESNYGSGDARIATKVRIFSEQEGWRPTFGLRFGTKLPNASTADHLGTDRVDWGGEMLFSKQLGPVAAHVNLGLQIWDNPGEGSSQDDLFSYDVGVASDEIGTVGPFGLRLVAELAGLTGSRFGNDRSAFRGGFQLRGQPITLFGGVGAGLIRESENVSGFLGLIWTFEAF